MRVLQPLWDGGGNVAPQLAIARALVARGHEVTILGDPCQRERAEGTGAGFRPYRHAPTGASDSPDTDFLRDWEAKTPIGAFARTRDRLMFGPAARYARDVLEALEERPADVVAWDYLLLGAGVGAERAGVPSVAVIHTVYPLPVDGVPPFGLGLQPASGRAGRARDGMLRRAFARILAPGMRALNAARTDLGLDPLESPFDQLVRCDRALVLTAREFDFAGSADLPPNVSYAGPVPAGAAQAWEPPWPAGDTRPLVVASFSTTFMDQNDLAARAAEALGGLPVRGLVTTGPAIGSAAFGAPENVTVVDYAPHGAVFPQADLVITHAGLGTVHAALAAGTPLVCMPGGRDQNDVAARVVAHGAGVRTGQSASAAKLQRVVREALANPSLTAGAERMAAVFAASGDGAEAAAEEIEAAA